MKTIESEIQQARQKYGPFNSTHEIYGVLQEEVDEFWDLVKMKHKGPYEKVLMIHELMQVAAIAQRAINEIKNGEIKFI
jgi:hypothetical protein